MCWHRLLFRLAGAPKGLLLAAICSSNVAVSPTCLLLSGGSGPVSSSWERRIWWSCRGARGPAARRACGSRGTRPGGSARASRGRCIWSWCSRTCTSRAARSRWARGRQMPGHIRHRRALAQQPNSLPELAHNLLGHVPPSPSHKRDPPPPSNTGQRTLTTRGPNSGGHAT